MPIGLRGSARPSCSIGFHEIAREERLRVGFIEAPESGDFRGLLATRLRAILLDLDRGAVSKAVTRALGTLKSFAYTLPDGSSIAIDVDAVAGRGDSGVLSEDITDLLVATGEAAHDRGTGVVLAIDEVQYLLARQRRRSQRLSHLFL